jgi:hypothetical protein
MRYRKSRESILKSITFVAGLLLVSCPQLIPQVCVSKQPSCLNESCREVWLSSWHDDSIVRVNHNQLFLQALDGRRTLLYRDKVSCSDAAAFLDSSHIFVQSCAGAFVLNSNGVRLYKMPRFEFWDIASNSAGTKFAVFERGRSAWHQFGDGSYDKLRLLVFRTDTGEKLFERKWGASPDEDPISERVGLSDEGTLYLCRKERPPLSFPVPGLDRP